MPLMPGIERSTIARSKSSRRIMSIASKPEFASAMNQSPCSAFRMRLSPSRISVWSSTSSTRVVDPNGTVLMHCLPADSARRRHSLRAPEREAESGR